MLCGFDSIIWHLANGWPFGVRNDVTKSHELPCFDEAGPVGRRRSHGDVISGRHIAAVLTSWSSAPEVTSYVADSRDDHASSDNADTEENGGKVGKNWNRLCELLAKNKHIRSVDRAAMTCDASRTSAEVVARENVSMQIF